MEAGIARLESDVAHLRTDMSDVRADVRSLRDKTDALAARFDMKLDAVRNDLHADMVRLGAKDDVLADEVQRLTDSIAAAKIWALLFYVALAGAMLGTMARGFGWL
jgi:hypothetical protein